MTTYYVTDLPGVSMRELFLINDVHMVKLVKDICDTLDTWFVDSSAIEVAKLIEQYIANKSSSSIINSPGE